MDITVFMKSHEQEEEIAVGLLVLVLILVAVGLLSNWVGLTER